MSALSKSSKAAQIGPTASHATCPEGGAGLSVPRAAIPASSASKAEDAAILKKAKESVKASSEDPAEALKRTTATYLHLLNIQLQSAGRISIMLDFNGPDTFSDMSDKKMAHLINILGQEVAHNDKFIAKLRTIDNPALYSKTHSLILDNAFMRSKLTLLREVQGHRQTQQQAVVHQLFGLL